MSAISLRNQRAVSWCGPLYVVGILVGFCLIAGLIPPPHASDSAQEVADLYRSDTDAIRIGLFITITATSLLAPFSAVIAVQMLRIESRRSPVLTSAQLVNGAIGSLVLMIAFIIMMVAAFDPGRPVDITKALHELGWILLVIPYMPFCIQYVCIGVAILQDQSEAPVFPRWVAYYNFWVAIGFVPTGLIGFFHRGPFAWHGVLGFWVPVVVYGGWFLVMTYALRRAIAQRQ